MVSSMKERMNYCWGIIKYLRWHVRTLKTELVHDPSSFDPMRCSISVEHQCFPHPYQLPCSWINYSSIFACCFPVSTYCCSVCTITSAIFSIAKTEEVPFFGVQLCHILIYTTYMIL